jgi:signal transduction histidine kinase
LSFVKEVVEQHNGSVSVESEVGRGSKFSFALPRL